MDVYEQQNKQKLTPVDQKYQVRTGNIAALGDRESVPVCCSSRRTALVPSLAGYGQRGIPVVLLLLALVRC